MITNELLWRQLGAAIDMLEQAVQHCPDELWRIPEHSPTWREDGVVGFWYLVFHTLFWLDCYLTGSQEGFLPPEPFGLEEFDPAGALPPRPYTRAELQSYLEHVRTEAREAVATMTEESAAALCTFPWGSMSYTELLLYNIRHVQHHAAQLYLLLRQETFSAPGWRVIATQPLNSASGGV